MVQFADISHFNKTSDYAPIILGALVTDLCVIVLLLTGFIKSKTLKEWYNKYGLGAVIADVLIIVIGVIIARFVYFLVFSKYSLLLFVCVAVGVQLVHDLSFAKLLQYVPRGKSAIMDTFTDYVNEMGAVILLADASMVVSTVVLAALIATLPPNMIHILMIVVVYMIPYLVYSV